MQRIMHGAFIGNRQKPLPGLIVQVAFKPDDPFEMVDFGGFVVGAVFAVIRIRPPVTNNDVSFIEG